jgi:hypothetical protein
MAQRIKLPCTPLAGTVSRFDPHEKGEQFGFIVPTRYPKESVFFRTMSQRHFICDGGPVPVPVYDPHLRHPKVGDKVIFFAETTEQGHKAKVWGCEETWDEALKACNERPTYRLYERHGREKKSRLHPTPQINVLWEGKDLPEFRALKLAKPYFGLHGYRQRLPKST